MFKRKRREIDRYLCDTDLIYKQFKCKWSLLIADDSTDVEEMNDGDAKLASTQPVPEDGEIEDKADPEKQQKYKS